MPRWARRRRPLVLGGVGLAAVLGVGGFMALQTSAGAATDPVARAAAQNVASDDPSAAASDGTGPSTAPAPSAGAATSAPGAAVMDTTATPSPMTSEQRIGAARSAAAMASNNVRQPLPPAPGGASASASVSETTSPDRTTLRIVSARADLTGQRELAWVADDGHAVGDAHCSQNFRLSANQPVSHKPNMLICWRVSTAKSVFTVLIDQSGHPSEADSVAAIDKTWLELG
ncbi:hypothetical protein ACQP1P_43460 [Dactylosporangium sp. CA-052675]|uniref:hypothetical protein n=1 Tax=Dactylosporangium sp. CA-052675 TaxID=3239927 RepID=UPI003D91C2D0